MISPGARAARNAHLTMIVASALIATSFPVVHLIAQAVHPLVLILVRFLIASLLFLPYLLWRHREHLLPQPRALIRYGLLALTLVGFFWAMFEALRWTTAVNTGALFTLGPIWSAAFGFVIAGERLGRLRLLALGVGLIGALAVVFRGDLSAALALEFNWGDGIFVLGTVAYGLYAALIRRLHRGEPMVVMTFWTLAMGTGWLALLALPYLGETDWSAVAPAVWGWVAYLALFTTLITFVLTQAAVNVIGPTRTMAYGYLNPAFVMLWAWLFTGGAFEVAALPGVALTLVAMWVLQRSATSPIKIA